MKAVRLTIVLMRVLAAAKLALCAAVVSCGLMRAAENFVFDVWRTDNGLPQNSVYAVRQTRDGYLWLTTYDGLVRFDGARFVVFRRGDAPGLTTSRFRGLFEDRDGALWITTHDSGLIVHRNGEFHAYFTRDGLPSDRVRSLREDDDGMLLVDTPAGVARRVGDRFVADESVDFGYPVAPGVVWRRDGLGLHRVVKGRSVRDLDVTGLPSAKIAGLFEDSRGDVWAWNQAHALMRWPDGQRSAQTLDLPPDASLMAAAEDAEGRVWFGFNRGQLRYWRNGHLVQPSLTPDFGSWIVWDLYRDKEMGLWAATQNGLFRIRPPLISSLSVRDGLTPAVSTILEDRSGRIWAGGLPGMTISDGGPFRPFDPARLANPGWTTTLFEDRRGGIWIATWGGKVMHLHDGKTDIIMPSEYGVTNSGVSVFLEDRQGTLWMGTRTGLVRYGSPPKVYSRNDGLRSTEINALLEDRAGTLWIGGSSGLARLRDGVFHSFTPAEGFPDATVQTIHEDSDGVLWIGTYDRGLVRYGGGRFTTYTTREGLFNNGVFQILEDRQGRFWIGCNKGVYRVGRMELNEVAKGLRQEVNAVPYGTRDGMLNAECDEGHPGAIQASDGRLWFATQGGIAIFDPARTLRNNAPPPVRIEEFLLDNRPVPTDRPVRAGPGNFAFEIHYTAPSFARPELVRFKYKLDGLDSQWVDAGTRRVAYYSHVPPGRYTFRVIAANADGVWNNSGAALEVVVLPPFWKTLWFAVMAAGSGAAILYTLYRRRVGAIERARALQAAFSRQLIDSEEQERKRIAGELHDGLGQDLLVMRNWALLGKMRSEPESKANQQFQEISDMAAHAIDDVRQIAHNLRPHQLDEMGLTQAIRSIGSMAADSSTTQFSVDVDPIDGLFSKEAEINLYRIVQESVNNIIKHSAATQARIAVRRINGAVQLMVEDNGRGIAPDRSRGFGMRGMEERARIIGAELVIQPLPGKGARVVMTMHPEAQVE